jgi:hypothetical protein
VTFLGYSAPQTTRCRFSSGLRVLWIELPLFVPDGSREALDVLLRNNTRVEKLAPSSRPAWCRMAPAHDMWSRWAKHQASLSRPIFPFGEQVRHCAIQPTAGWRFGEVLVRRT